MSIVQNYSNIPISNRIGVGNYTYKCVLDTSDTGIIKIEIFANTVDEAMYIIGVQYGNILEWTYIDNDVISLVLAPYSDGVCLLYI